MALDLMKEQGVPLEKQLFDWHDMVRTPISKLDNDAFTRVRIILMNGIENEQFVFLHSAARQHDSGVRVPLARVRRVEQHQQTLVNWLLPADQSVLETTLAYEQVAVEVTAALAEQEPDPYVKQVLEFGLLEDFDHLYRYSALIDRLEGKDPNNILQSYTDVRPGRPTAEEHRAPIDDVRDHYDAKTASPITKMNVLTILAGEQQTRNYYATVGPLYADPMARQVYAEISSIEEQHVTQYESLADPNESWAEKWLLHEANEVYNYFTCLQQEGDARIKKIWERFLDYELGHLHFAMEHFKRIENRDPAEILPQTLPEPFKYTSHRDYVTRVLQAQVDLNAQGTQFVHKSQIPAGAESVRYREQLNSKGSPTETVAAGYRWTPGTELVDRAASMQAGHA
ncbi:MAG TPA: hypothetical protein DFS52_16960 [Myxococcales bacterium]|jgi:hypothetical protein|nr:hypothetical protein [Myxococcales bacterium]